MPPPTSAGASSSRYSWGAPTSASTPTRAGSLSPSRSTTPAARDATTSTRSTRRPHTTAPPRDVRRRSFRSRRIRCSRPGRRSAERRDATSPLAQRVMSRSIPALAPTSPSMAARAASARSSCPHLPYCCVGPMLTRLSMIPKKPAPHLMRGGYRFSEKIMHKKSRQYAYSVNTGSTEPRHGPRYFSSNSSAGVIPRSMYSSIGSR